MSVVAKVPIGANAVVTAGIGYKAIQGRTTSNWGSGPDTAYRYDFTEITSKAGFSLFW